VRRPARVNLDKLQPARDDAPAAVAAGAGVLDAVLDRQQQAWRLAQVGRVDQDGPAPEQLTIAGNDCIEDRVEQRVARGQRGLGKPGFPGPSPGGRAWKSGAPTTVS